MSDTIKGAGDIYEQDLYGDIRESGKTFISVLEAMNQLLKETSILTGKKVDVDVKNIKGVNEVNKAIEQTNELFEEKIKLDEKVLIVQNKINKANEIDGKQIADLEIKIKKLSSTRSSLLKQQQEANRQREEGNERIAKTIDLTEDEQKTLARVSKELFIAQKQRTQLNKTNSDSVKTINDLAAIQGKELNTLERLTVRNRLLRKEIKGINFETEAGQKRIKAINKELDANTAKIKANVDAFSRDKLAIGGYEEAIKNALGETEELSGTLGASTESVDELVPGLGKAAEGVGGLGKAFKALLANPIVLLLAAIVGAIVAVGSAMAGTEAGAIRFEKASARLGATFDVLKGKLASFGEEVVSGKFFDDLADQATSFFDDLKEGGFTADTFFQAFQKQQVESLVNQAKLNAEIKAAQKAAEAIVILEKAYEEVNLELSLTIANLNKVAESQELISQDLTKSFKARAAAASEARTSSERAAKIELELAESRDFIAQKQFEQQKRVNQLSAEDIAERTHAQEDLINAQKNLLLVQIRNQQAIDLIRQDRLERDQELLETGFNNQKTINDKIINNESIALLEREKLFRKTEKLSEDLYNKQIENVEKFAGISIDQNDLINESDTVLLAEKIRALGVSEVVEGRILRSINQRKKSLQELIDIEDSLLQFRIKQQELLDSIEISLIDDDFEQKITKLLQSSDKVFAEIDQLRKNDIISQQQANDLREQETERVTNEINQIEIKAGKKKIDDATEISKAEFEVTRGGFKTQRAFEKEKEAQFLAIKRKQLEDKLALIEKFGGEENEVEKAKLKEQLENLGKEEKKSSKERIKLQQETIAALDQITQGRSEKRLKEIDKELTANEKIQDQLRASAAKGVLDADKSLASEEKRQAELERERQREVRRQELRTAGFKILSALLEQGKSPQEAIPEVGVLLGALPAVIEAIPAFIEGTEDVAKSLGKPQLKGRDGHIIRVDGKERIVDPKNNAKMGGVSNDEAADIVSRYNRGTLGDLQAFNNPKFDSSIGTNWQTNQQILDRFETLENNVVKTNIDIKKAIENKPVITDVHYNKILRELTTVMQENNKTIITRSKQKGII